jgi:hypothetical protein
MNIRNIILTCLGVLSFSTGNTRNFYETGFDLHAEYANIETGSEDLFSYKLVKLRYSDDKQFCIIYFNQTKYPCSIVEFKSGSPFYPTVKIARTDIISFFSYYVQNTKANQNVKDSFCRLILQLPEGYTLTKDSEFKYQFHDEQPESIHVRIDSLRSGSSISLY